MPQKPDCNVNSSRPAMTDPTAFCHWAQLRATQGCAAKPHPSATDLLRTDGRQHGALPQRRQLASD